MNESDIHSWCDVETLNVRREIVAVDLNLEGNTCRGIFSRGDTWTNESAARGGEVGAFLY